MSTWVRRYGRDARAVADDTGESKWPPTGSTPDSSGTILRWNGTDHVG
ncbi:MAG: hypothetical protein NTW76_20525 [Corynebacteriales bacterium]|nr:hypothetical protein [Mycobacteriales bacterium]